MFSRVSSHPLSGRHLWTLTGPSKRSSTLKMDMCALSLHSQGASRDPSELQFPEYHHGLQKNSCTESHPTHHLDRLRAKQELDQHCIKGYLQPQHQVQVYRIQGHPPQAPRRNWSSGVSNSFNQEHHQQVCLRASTI